MYSPAMSRTVTCPAGNTAVRENGAAIDSTGLSGADRRGRPTVVCTCWM